MSGLEGLLTGRTLVKRYRIEEVVGRGGFAVVYRAGDESLGRTVAVKVIAASAPDAQTRERNRERFEREARAAASLSHPNVVTVHDFGTDPALDIDFLVMEFLHGEDLATHLAHRGRPPLELALRILTEAAQGLAAGHRAGLVHRDVKPGNLFLAAAHGADPFRVCVLDFGIARAAEADRTITHFAQDGVPLSPAYASPEQARGELRLSPASDVFSLGVVGHQLLTGEKPYRVERGSDPADWVPERGVREADPLIPPAVERVVRRAMAFDPADRFPDAGAMAGALEEAARLSTPAAIAARYAAPAPVAADATLVQSAPPPAVREGERRAPRRSGSFVWGLLFLVLAGAGGVAVWGGGREPSGGAGRGAMVVSELPDLPPGEEEPSRADDPERAEDVEDELPLSVVPIEPAVVDLSPLPDTAVVIPLGPDPALDAEILLIEDLVTDRLPADSAPPPPAYRPPPRLLGEPVHRTDPPPLPSDTTMPGPAADMGSRGGS